MESRGGFPRKGGLRWTWREPGQVSGQEDGSRQRPLKVPKEGCLAGWFWRLMGDPQPLSVGLGLSPCCFSASLNNWKEIWETSLTISVWSLRKQKSRWLLEKTIQEAHEKDSPHSLLCNTEKIISMPPREWREQRTGPIAVYCSAGFRVPLSPTLGWLNPTRECGTT